jgi:K+-sensing histidine kinase KdpD
MASSLPVQRLTDDAARARVARPRGPAARRRLRIYLGYVPGAGTTCALLSEGRQRAESSWASTALAL